MVLNLTIYLVVIKNMAFGCPSECPQVAFGSGLMDDYRVPSAGVLMDLPGWSLPLLVGDSQIYGPRCERT